MSEEKWVPGTEVELENEFIVLAIPSSSVQVEITATIFEDGELHKCHRVMDMQEVRDAIQEAKDGYIPSDAVFTLTDLGRQELERLKERYRGDGEE